MFLKWSPRAKFTALFEEQTSLKRRPESKRPWL